MNSTKRKEYTLLALLIAASIGILPFLGSSCSEIMVVDPETGTLQPATPEQVAEIVGQVGDVANVIAVGTGNPQFMPFIHLGTQLAILITAFLYKRKIDRD